MLTCGVECRLHVHRWGQQGPLVIALQSSGMTGLQWRHLANLGEDRFRFWAPDLLNWGQSPSSPNGLRYRHQEDLEQILALIDESGEEVSLAGHSYGGFLALKTALARPDKVLRLALYEPVIWGGLASFSQRSIHRIVERFDPEGLLLNESLAGQDHWMERFIDYWNGPGTWANFSANARRPLQEQSSKLFAEVREAVTDPTPHTEYRGIQAPTLIVHGTVSPPETLAMKEILKRQIPQCATVCVEGGHMAPVRAPKLVDPHLSTFLLS